MEAAVSGNYPPSTWAGDPGAPWNEPEEGEGQDDWEAQNEFSLDWDIDFDW